MRLGQDSLTRFFADWRVGTFKNSFRDLDQAGHEFANLDLDEVQKILDTDAAKGAEVFEVLGIKIPVEQVTAWGSAIIIGIQIYLLIFLKQLSGKLRSDDPGWDVPWVGMDMSRFAKSVFLVTLVILPITAVALLNGRAYVAWRKILSPDKGWPRFLDRVEPYSLGLIVVASVCLGILSWHYRPKLEPQEPPTPTPLFY
jgi:hypothetical protein